MISIVEHICLVFLHLPFLGDTPAQSLPKHWVARASAWEQVKSQNSPGSSFHWGGARSHENAAHDGYLKLTFPSVKFVESVTYAANISTPFELIPPKHILKKTALVALVDGTPWDLTRPLPPKVTSVEIIDFNHPIGVDTVWHSSAHILGQALEYYYKDHTVYLSDGPALQEGGFFYDLYIKVSEPNDSLFWQ